MAIKKICTLLIVLNLSAMTICEHYMLVDQLRIDFLNLEERLWKFVLWEAQTVNQRDAEFYLVKMFTNFDQRLQNMPQDILRGLDPVRHIKSFLFLYSELKNTENLYEKFRKFQEDHEKLNNLNYNGEKKMKDIIHIQDIVRDILSPKTGANITVEKVYDLTFGKKSMAMEVYELFAKDYFCKDYFQSPQQVLYNLYNSIALNGLKDYMMLQFAYLASRIVEKGNYTELSNTAQTNFANQVNETMAVFRGAMELARTGLWRCDPKKHIKDVTYVEFTRLLQGHIQNEVDMNPGGTCRENCALYHLTTSHGCYDSDSKYCQEMERCTGRILSCQFVESRMDICLSKSTSRRYEYIEYESGKIMGSKTRCWKKPVKSWWRWFVHCSYCMCLCDEQGPKSDRYVNMRPVVADISNNRVVTGLRFVKNNRVVHLQIQEGKLLPYGYIDNSTVRWVPVNDYKITDSGVYSGVDYFTMTYENRSIAINEMLTDNPDYVVTGVRLVYKDNMLRFQLQANSFDWNSGLVSPNISTSTYLLSGGKYEIDLSNADVPTKSPPTEINYNSDTFVKFSHTDFDKDAAQTTIPFIDAQPVFNDPPVPLQGAGIQYRGHGGYGGFIAPKIVTYSFSRLILVQLSPNAPEVEPRLEVEPLVN